MNDVQSESASDAALSTVAVARASGTKMLPQGVHGRRVACAAADALEVRYRSCAGEAKEANLE